jgi:D-lactate dehydrogenase (cytochrome)
MVTFIEPAASGRDPAAVSAAIGLLTQKFGNRLVTSQAVREQHGNTLTWVANQPPDAVVFPQSAAGCRRSCASARRIACP